MGITFDHRSERTKLIDEAIGLRKIYGETYRDGWHACQNVIKAGTKTGSIINSVGIALIREFPEIEFLKYESDAEAYESIREYSVKELDSLNNSITGLRHKAAYNLVRNEIMAAKRKSRK